MRDRLRTFPVFLKYIIGIGELSTMGALSPLFCENVLSSSLFQHLKLYQ